MYAHVCPIMNELKHIYELTEDMYELYYFVSVVIAWDTPWPTQLSRPLLHLGY